MAFKIVELVLASAVADDGTVTGIAYPSGTNQAFFTSGNESDTGVAIINGNDVYAQADPGIDITYGASTITLTNLSGVSWAAGDEVLLQLGYAGESIVNVIAQPAEADLAGSLTGTPDGTMTNVAATAAATAGGSAPTAAQVDTGIATAVASIVTGVNVNFEELQLKLNNLLAKLRAAGVLET